MPSYDIFFFSIVFFLIGILAASFGVSFLITVVAAILLAAIFLFIHRSRLTPIKTQINADTFLILGALSFFIIVGAGYYRWDDLKYKDINIVFNKEINFSGLVIDDPQFSSESRIQTLVVQLNESYRGKILAKLPLYPNFHYGDKLAFRGTIKKLQVDSYARYLVKEKISGIVNFPKVELKDSGQGSSIKLFLFRIKHSAVDSFQKVLSPNRAAFLAGLTFGERGDLTKEFKKAMNLSGTSHLVALSGLHLTIISVALATVMRCFFSPVLAFVLTILVIFGFVAMTGFKFSAVRAAIMGFSVLLAKLVGRIYDPRNSIALAAFLITLFNPKALVFDLGFQLSFLAVLGIIYLQPALKKLLKLKENPGFLSWRDNFLMTLSAQISVAPILIINFGNFSPTALIANVLILAVIPLTMALGFLIGFFHFLSYYLALIFGWLVSLLLAYEIFIINFFAKIVLPINPSLNFWSVSVYYLMLAGIIVWSKAKR